MILLIANRHVITSDQCREHAKVRLIARAKNERFFFPQEGGKSFLKLAVQGQCAVEESRPRAARSEFTNGFCCRFPNSGMHGQAKVVVGAKHDEPAFADNDLGSFGMIQWDKERIDTQLLGSLGIGWIPHALGDGGIGIESSAFLKHVHFVFLSSFYFTP